MPRTITESQYELLRVYRDGHDRWINGGPPAALISRGLLSAAPHDRSMFRITLEGQEALSAFETRYGIKV